VDFYFRRDCNLGAQFLLIPEYSYMGSAIATIAAYGSMMLLSYFLGRNQYPIPYDINRIGGYLAISIVFSGVSFYYFRENYYVGIALLLVYLYFIYHNEKETLLRIIKEKGAESRFPLIFCCVNSAKDSRCNRG
jgi:O-antigen/teichoic acid export membrane protein